MEFEFTRSLSAKLCLLRDSAFLPRMLGVAPEAYRRSFTRVHIAEICAHNGFKSGSASAICLRLALLPTFKAR